MEENAHALTCLALEMQKLCATLQAPDGTQVVMRIGLHCGPLVGGVVGGSMLRYHLFGSPMDAVTQVRLTATTSLSFSHPFPLISNLKLDRALLISLDTELTIHTLR